jgi:adenine-specific DNA-methyltransferase
MSAISTTLRDFATKPLADAGEELFKTLGYGTEIQQRYASLKGLLEAFDTGGKVAKAFGPLGKRERSEPVLLQQLTTAEIEANSGGQLQLMAPDALDTRDINTYLFLTVALSEDNYTRTRLAELARALNSMFAPPLLVLFHYGDHVSLAITYRRKNKQDESKDVIERKVTFIKDVHATKPHPGHIAILEDFSLPHLNAFFGRPIKTFNDLDDAWRQSLSSELLNKKFYRDIANWYFYSREHVRFPKVSDIDEQERINLALIRLLTRLIFCWFLREKNELVPDELFHEAKLKALLKDMDPEAGSYYTAILQNLFFATLNTDMDAATGSETRRFAVESDAKDSDDHMVHSFWRYADLIKNRKKFEELYRNVPFLNGGLFECLDDRVRKGRSTYTKEVRIDGFASDPAKRPHVPNFLFFGEGRTVDLSDALGDNRRTKEKFRPLLEIFRSYKFTLAENTPIEEEVALDPELLGHVFENLLAAYNPETGTVARKATGSFYTPRVVVDWMVDQALLVHLENKLPESARVNGEQLKHLLSWEEGPALKPAQCDAVVNAINGLKAIDPACGSGAFLMGLLQKLVHVLGKVDPDNTRWKKLQEDAAKLMPSAPAREAAMQAIQKAFTLDHDDYGRKLYLIENGLFGVDIQPVAVQIAKLRFFISLIVDQAIDKDRPQDNYGILALPNLETQIVAANSLLGLESVQWGMASDELIELEKELREVRHEYFTARKYSKKKALRKRDEELRDKVADELVNLGGISSANSHRLAEWNPYDTNRAAPFFSPTWMFGMDPGTESGSEGVFDIVIENPPYVRHEELKHQQVLDNTGVERPLKEVLKDRYACYAGTADLLVYFFERSFQLLKTGGVLCTITSNKYMRSGYGERLRTYLRYATRMHTVLDFGDAPVFTAIAYPCILVAQKTRQVGAKDLPKILNAIQEPPDDQQVRVLRWEVGPHVNEFPLIFEQQAFDVPQRQMKSDGWQLEGEAGVKLMERIVAAGPKLIDYCERRLYYGIKTGLNEAFVVDRETRDRLIAEHPSSAEVLKPYLRGRDVKRWKVEPQDLWLIFTRRGIDIDKYPAIKKHLALFKKELMPGAAGGRKPGHYEWFHIQDNIAYYEEFEEKKIIIPAITGTVNYAPDTQGYYCNDKASILIPPSVPYALAILNSRVSLWYAKQRFPTKQGSFYEFKPTYLAKQPIATATDEQRILVERLSSALIWLSSTLGGFHEPDVPLFSMIGYFEQWLNGMVYELYFPGELQGRGLRAFDATAAVFKNYPEAKEPKKNNARVKYWQALFEEVYDTKHPLRNLLFTLRSLEVVRQIEDLDKPIEELAAERMAETDD